MSRSSQNLGKQLAQNGHRQCGSNWFFEEHPIEWRWDRILDRKKRPKTAELKLERVDEVGSSAKKDNCGVCAGDGSTCRLVRGQTKVHLSPEKSKC